MDQQSPAANKYWEERRDTLYYQVIRILVDGISKDAESIIDVGSAGCPYLDWFPHIRDKASIDLSRPYKAPGIRSFKGDFLAWEPDKRYDIATCFQVMEHVPDVEAFAKKLLSIADTVVVSVPYKWPETQTASHIHDPIDEEKLLSWFGRKPNFEYIVTEIVSPIRRIVHVYDGLPKRWKGIKGRNRILETMQAASPAPASS